MLQTNPLRAHACRKRPSCFNTPDTHSTAEMTRTLDILEDYIRIKGFEYCRIDGKTSSADRETAMDDYNAPDSTKFLFLLSTRAGGVGINLYVRPGGGERRAARGCQ